MRNVVMYNDFREAQIRPNILLDRYLAMVEKEVKKYFTAKRGLVLVKCPACQSGRVRDAFRKFDMQYSECLDCRSLFISKRPSEEDLARFYRASKAARFYKREFVRKTAKSRDSLIFKPRAQWIADTVQEYFSSPVCFIDIKSSYGVFLEEVSALGIFRRKISVEPRIERTTRFFGKGKFEYFDAPLRECAVSGVEALSMFECIDRLFSPARYLKEIGSKMAAGGLLFITMPAISGLDLQVLWDRAKTIYPPDHLNILSVEGAQILLDRSGFDIIELSTPGQLDVELIKKAAKEDPGLKLPRFLDYILNIRGGDTHQALQEFLQEERLSSHVRLAAKKRKV